LIVLIARSIVFQIASSHLLHIFNMTILYMSQEVGEAEFS